MKAYQITEVYAETGLAFVVFAENVPKARTIGHGLFRLEDFDYKYTEISVKRLPLLDRFYKGKEEIDYENSEVKRILMEDYFWDYCEDAEE